MTTEPSVPEDGRLLPRLEVVYLLAVPRQRTVYRIHTHRFKTTSAMTRMASFRVIEWYRGARLNASTLRLTPCRAAQESLSLGRAGFLSLSPAPRVRHPQISERGTQAPASLCFRTCTESLYRAYTACCILTQGRIDCGQFFLPTTSWPPVWRFPRAILCSIPHTDFGEFPFHALRE
jgi:hypothetical protein